VATYAKARSERDAVFDHISGLLDFRPGAVGVMPLGPRSYGIKITLPRRTSRELPKEVNGVPVQYDVAASQPALVGGAPRGWHLSALNRRA